MVAPRDALLLTLGLFATSGCAGVQDTEYAFANWTRSEICWLNNTTASQRRACSGDYEKGWKKGFYDSATGKACGLPAVPPPCYWSHKYQDCAGQKAISDWYRGYQCGVAAAESTGLPSFHDVPIGPCPPIINKTGCGACYSPDRCNCENQSTQVEMIHQPQFKFMQDSIGMIGPAGPSTEHVPGAEVRMASAEQPRIH